MILYCKCANTDLVTEEDRNNISEYLAHSGLEYIELSDFCDQTTLSPAWLKRTLSSSLVVIACYPRAVDWLFHTSGISVEELNIKYFNLREQKSTDIIAALAKFKELEKGSRIEINEENRPFGWFPVIDYNRCTYCGQCMDFCLFGVYERLPDKSIKVVKPQNCKDKCPACARICPHVAIMFPKLKEKPINGAEVSESADANKNLQVDVNDMLGDDVYAALAARKKRAKTNLLKSQDAEKAEAEKKNCSCKCSSTTKQTKNTKED